MSEKQVVAFTKPDCSACAAVKQFLAEREIPFIERDVENEDDAFGELLALRVLCTPVTKIED